MDKRQTAIDWLVKEFNLESFEATIKLAKSMEKEQIKEAYYKPLSNEYWHKGEQWLNEESEIYYTSNYGQ